MKPGFVIAIALVWYAVSVVDCANFIVDDTYIPMRYAENAAQGKGLVFNDGERVEGYSDFLWTAMLCGGVAMGANLGTHGPLALLVFAKSMGALFGFATILVLAWLLAGIKREFLKDHDSPLLWLALIGVPASWSFDMWSMSGLETSMCAFFTTLTAALLFRGVVGLERKSSHATGYMISATFSIVLAALVRPEQAFIWALALIGLWFVIDKPHRSVILRYALLAAVGLAFYIGWRYSYYGSFLPNSVIAKSGGGFRYRVAGMRNLIAGLSSTLGIMAIGVLGLRAVWKQGTALKMLVLVVASGAVFVVLSGGDWMPGYRFLVPVIPILWTVVMLGFGELLRRYSGVSASRIAWIVILLFMLGAHLNERTGSKGKYPFPTGFGGMVWHGDDYDSYFAAASKLHDIVPAGATLAIGDCGIIPYCNPSMRILDLNGLMDAQIARLPGAMHGTLTLEHFFARNPEYYAMVVVYDAPGGDNHYHAIYPDGLLLEPSQEFHRRYAPVAYLRDFVVFKKN